MRTMLRKAGLWVCLGLTCAAVTAGSLPADEGRTVASGTELKIRTTVGIDSKTAHEGQSFSGIVEENIVGSTGETLIPKGSDAALIIRKAAKGELILDLQSVTVGGRTYGLSTADLKETSHRGGIGKNRRTAEMVGGGAAVGTIIGAIAGHGKGAAIGAVSGAAAGGAAQVLTNGKEIRVPAESVLTFRLSAPLHV